jgi:hypothetical protein
MMDSIEGARHDAHDSRSPDRSASDHHRSRQAGRVRQDVMPQTYRGLWSRRVMREKSMNLIQHYQEKAARADRLADDPYQKADMRGTPFNGAQMASFGRTLRLARPSASISEAVRSLAREFLQRDNGLHPRNEFVAWECSVDLRMVEFA